MRFIIFNCFLRIFIGIAIFTAVRTSIIRTDITGFDTMAAMPRTLMFQRLKIDVVRTAEDVKRHAARRMDSIP